MELLIAPFTIFWLTWYHFRATLANNTFLVYWSRWSNWLVYYWWVIIWTERCSFIKWSYRKKLIITESLSLRLGITHVCLLLVGKISWLRISIINDGRLLVDLVCYVHVRWCLLCLLIMCLSNKSKIWRALNWNCGCRFFIFHLKI